LGQNFSLINSDIKVLVKSVENLLKDPINLDKLLKYTDNKNADIKPNKDSQFSFPIA
jgi:hypothetical protein